MGARIPSLEINVVLESSPLKSTMSVGRLSVAEKMKVKTQRKKPLISKGAWRGANRKGFHKPCALSAVVSTAYVSNSRKQINVIYIYIYMSAAWSD